jgi:phenylpyruvate tautomerase PptA (4-oxalocrotonate tautomerase family)
MPILTIEIVQQPDEALATDLATRLADRAGDIFGSTPGGTWVKIIAIAQYGENHSNDSYYPVFGRVLHSRPPEGDDLQRQITDLTRAIAEEVKRPAENVHLIFEPPGVNRVAFGGTLVR